MKKPLKFAIAILALLALGALGVFELSDSKPVSGPRPEETAAPVGAVTARPVATPEVVAGSVVTAGATPVAGKEAAAASAPAAGAGAGPAVDARANTGTGLDALPPPEDADGGPSPKTYTPEQFQALTKKTLRDLPTPAQMRDLTDEEAHGYPAPLAKAGPMLGKIAQAVQDQPALAAAASDFYRTCTQDQDILAPVRALCYSHILKDPRAPAPQSLPAEVVRLAHLIPAEDSARGGTAAAAPTSAGK